LGDVLTLIDVDGKLRAGLRTQAEQIDLKGVHFLGHQAQPDVAKPYNVSDVSTSPPALNRLAWLPSQRWPAARQSSLQ
jgi:hypothetical protein